MQIVGHRITCNKVENKREIVEVFYLAEDDEWHKNVHENGGTCQENIEDSLKTISEESEMFEVDCDGNLAAFFTKFEDKHGSIVMECFHVAKEYRTSEFLKKFWEIVKIRMDRFFWVGVYEQNKEAVKHIRKQGFQFVGTKEHLGKKIFIYKSNI